MSKVSISNNFRDRALRFLASKGLAVDTAGTGISNKVLIEACEGVLGVEVRGDRHQKMATLGRKIPEVWILGTPPKSKRPATDFYETAKWKEVRYMALLANDGRCELCGASKKDGVILHVDHIKPRSKYPELRLDPNNLQVLCEPCNMGKSNIDETDWRSHKLRVVE